MKRKLCLSLFAIFLTISNLSFAKAADSYEKGWAEFSTNNRVAARKSLNTAVKDEASKAEALFSLSLLDWTEEREKDAFKHLTEAYAACNAEQANAFLYSMWSLPFAFTSRGAMEDYKLAFLQTLENDPKLNGTLQAMINAALGSHFRACKQFEKAKTYFNKIGAIDKWQILGSFQNVSGSGFDKNFGVLEKPLATDRFKDYQQNEIFWYNAGENQPDKWFYFNYFIDSDDAIVYSQSFVKSDVTQEVTLRVGVSGSVKVWINDALVMSVEQERNCDLDVYATKIVLAAGYNRILLQLGEGEISGSNHLVRITDDNANPIENLIISADFQPYTKVENTKKTELLPFFPEKFFEEKLKAKPNNILYAALLAETFLRNDKAEESIILLRKVKEKTPKSTLIHYLLYEAYMRDGNNTFATKEMEDIKQHDEESMFALQQKLLEDYRSSKVPDVKDIREKIEKLYGVNETTRNIDYWLASNQKDDKKQIALTRAEYERKPYSYGNMLAVFNIEDNKMKDSRTATAILEDYCQKYFNPEALQQLSDRYILNGETEKGLKLLQERMALMPYQTVYKYNYANTLFKMQRYEEALRYTDEYVKKSPFDADIYKLRAEIFKAQDNKKAAIENYKKAIVLQPGDFSSRKQLRSLDALKEMEDLFPKNDLNALIKTAGNQADYPEDHSLILLFDSQAQYHAEGTLELRFEMAVKILNQTGIEVWKEQQLSGGSGFSLDKAELIKANGQKVKAETSHSHVVFTDLEVGDVLHLDYRTNETPSGIMAKQFNGTAFFQYPMPTTNISFSLLAPADKKFEYVTTNGNITPKISTVDGKTMYRWELKNQAGIKEEPLMPSFADVAAMLTFSTIPNWNFIAEWYQSLTYNKFKDDYLLTDTYNAILEGKQNASPLEKAELFYNYILKNITYSQVPFMQGPLVPQKASRTISTRLGDCKDVSTLFVALCRKAGIDANLVLVLTRDNGYNHLLLPNISFNHCIAQLNVANKTYYLELTDTYLPFNSALGQDIQAQILPVPYAGEKSKNNKIQQMEMPLRLQNTTTRNATFSIIDGKDVVINHNSVKRGALASYIRHIYVDLGSEERLKNMTQAVAADFSVPIQISNLKFDDLSSRADSTVYSYHLTAKNMVQNVAGMEIFKLVWVDNVGTLEEVSMPVRKFPLLLWTYGRADSDKETITVKIPAGRKFAEVPKDVEIDCTNASFSIKYNTSTKGELKITRTFSVKTSIVSVAEYEAFRTFMHRVAEQENKAYALINE